MRQHLLKKVHPFLGMFDLAQILKEYWKLPGSNEDFV